MDRRKHERRPLRLEMATVGLCLAAGMVVVIVCLLFTYTPLPLLLLDWTGFFTLCFGVFGMAVPIAHAWLLRFCCHQFLGYRPDWLHSAFLTIHGLIYVPYIALLVGPAVVAVWPGLQGSDEATRYLSTVLFAAGTALPAPCYLLYLHGQGSSWLRRRAHPGRISKAPPEIALRPRRRTTLRRRVRLWSSTSHRV